MEGTTTQTSKVPVTMLSGFLGAGKTTLLRYLLETSSLKIACIVNDVASINIDAKLVRNDRNRAKGDQVNTTKDLADTIELQNGCACCNLQDELFASFEQVLSMADKRGEPYARIVLENSGVAEPGNLRDKFKEAEDAGHPLLERIFLDTMVTVVDASTFGKDFASRQPLAARPDLGDGGNLRPVVDLLVEQVECADFVVLNKTDLMAVDAQPAAAGSFSHLEELVAIISSLNPLAAVVPCAQGRVPIETVFGAGVHAVVAKLNIEGQHRGAVAAAHAMQAEEGGDGHHAHADSSHGHGHAHEHSHSGHEHGEDCAVCGHDHEHGGHTHSHDSHAHEHGHSHEGHAHKHEHSHHDHEHGDGCAVCGHEGAGHEHSDHKGHHGHGTAHEHKEHDHAHEHHHHGHTHGERPATLAAQRFGIKSFVYCRRRPFHPQRLKEMVLKWLPVTSNAAIDDEAPLLGDSPVKAVLRSKGFMWMSNSHSTAYYWSHAGQHFEIRDEGDWWSAVPDEDWPGAGAGRDVILADWELDGPYGDRRQEIVFIGVGMDQDKICTQLDGALLTDEEMVKYTARWAAVPDPVHPAAEERKTRRAGN